MRQNAIRDMTYIAVCVALMAICSWIMIPSSPPFTLQTLAVFLAVGLLGGRRGTTAVVVYLLLGAVGLPVFAGFTGGLGILLGSTGGYFLGFLCTGLLMWAMEHLSIDPRHLLPLSMLLGLLACYAFGTAWYMAMYLRTTGPISLITVLGWCVAPFIIPDLAKIALALLILRRVKKYVS